MTGLLALFACIILAIYIRTLSPTIVGGDAGELVSEGCHLGTAHPPGYPLFTVMVHILSRLSLDNDYSVAYLVNISSSVLTSLAALFIGKSTSEVIRIYSWSKRSNGGLFASQFIYDQFSSILSMGLFAFSPLIWQYAVTAEVFPLNTFFAAFLIYLTIMYTKYRHFKYATIGSLICGLAICNQHTIVLFEAPLILWMLFTMRTNIQLYHLVQLGIVFIIGLTPYLYLPIMATISHKHGSWGDVTTLSGFIHHFLRKDYGTFQLFSGEGGKNSEGLLQRTKSYISDITLTQEYHGLLLYLSIIAILPTIYSICFPRYSSDGVSTHKASGNVSPPTEQKITKQKRRSAASKNDSRDSSNSLDNASKFKPSKRWKDEQLIILVLVITLAFYITVFHSLSNLPLSDKLLYGVHQRFWMQPNIIVFILAGIGFHRGNMMIISIFRYILNIYSSQGKKNTPVVPEISPNENKEVHIDSLKSSNQVIAAMMTLYLVMFQLLHNFDHADQSSAYYFKNYAKAIMDPLPQNSLLLVNYDMQWTSLRYLHICEKYRPDLTIINLSIMTYPWFEKKIRFYPHIHFPGKYLHYGRNQGGYTMFEFVKANIMNQRIYVSGKLSYPDPQFEASFELMPFGIVSQIIPVSVVPNSTVYLNLLNDVWKVLLQSIVSIPDAVKYPEETWEWTIGRDLLNRIEGNSCLS